MMAMIKVAKEKCNDGSDECFTGGLDDGLEMNSVMSVMNVSRVVQMMDQKMNSVMALVNAAQC